MSHTVTDPNRQLRADSCQSGHGQLGEPGLVVIRSYLRSIIKTNLLVSARCRRQVRSALPGRTRARLIPGRCHQRQLTERAKMLQSLRKKRFTAAIFRKKLIDKRLHLDPFPFACPSAHGRTADRHAPQN